MCCVGEVGGGLLRMIVFRRAWQWCSWFHVFVISFLLGTGGVEEGVPILVCSVAIITYWNGNFVTWRSPSEVVGRVAREQGRPSHILVFLVFCWSVRWMDKVDCIWDYVWGLTWPLCLLGVERYMLMIRSYENEPYLIHTTPCSFLPWDPSQRGCWKYTDGVCMYSFIALCNICQQPILVLENKFIIENRGQPVLVWGKNN